MTDREAPSPETAFATAGGAAQVDRLRAEFESVDAFFQALLGVRSVCAVLDRGVDELAGLREGATAAWALGGTVPTTDGAGTGAETALGGGDDASSSAFHAQTDDGTAVLLGLLALRRRLELDFQSLAKEGSGSRGEPLSSPGSVERSQNVRSGSLLR